MIERILKIGKQLLAQSEVTDVLELAMDISIELSKAERGMIILFQENGKMDFNTARHLDRSDIDKPQFEVSQTIIDEVRSTSQSICLKNALEDERLQDSQSAFELKIQSVICLPLMHERDVFGVIYLDNRSAAGLFKEATFELIKHLGDFISLAAYNALREKDLHDRVYDLEIRLRENHDFDAMIGHSSQMVEALKIIADVADTNVPVLIEGETGTGKELAAQALHHNSQRRERRLVSMNCGAMPENLLESELFGHEKGSFTGAHAQHRGKFAQADGGTLFLDEVDEMSQALQVKLLRVLQLGEFSPLGSEETLRCDVRIVAASKRSLKQMVLDGLFRDDLFYRLNLIKIHLEPLRERREDIPVLANYLMQRACKEFSKPKLTLSKEAETLLLQYDYPGNIRELENIMKRAVLLNSGRSVLPEHLPKDLVDVERQPSLESETFQSAKQKVIEDFERVYLQTMLKKSGGIISKAARLSGMYQANFHAKMKKYRIDARKL